MASLPHPLPTNLLLSVIKTQQAQHESGFLNSITLSRPCFISIMKFKILFDCSRGIPSDRGTLKAPVPSDRLRLRATHKPIDIGMARNPTNFFTLASFKTLRYT